MALFVNYLWNLSKLEKEKGTTGNTNHVTLRNFSFPGERFCLFFHSAGNASNILEKKVSACGARELVSLSRQGRRDKSQVTLLAILENSASFCTVFYFSLRTEQVLLFWFFFRILWHFFGCKFNFLLKWNNVRSK